METHTAPTKAYVDKEVRLAKRTFNAISIALVDQLLRLFEDNGTLKFIKGELQLFAKDPKRNHVPAVRYFKTMNLPTALKRDHDAGVGDDSVIVVGELVVRKDPVLFTDAVGVKISELENLGMIEKWPMLSKTNQEMVWDYLLRMAKTSAQVVIGTQMLSGQLAPILEKLSEKGTQVHPGMSETQFTEFAKDVKDAISSTTTTTTVGRP